MPMKRNRFIYLTLIFITISLGLASRRYSSFLPAWLAEYSGDTLWALMVYVCFGWLLPKHSTYKIALYALLFSYAIEISQLYHALWIDSIRNTKLGSLILGHTFVWSDLICYTAGVIIGYGIETAFFKNPGWLIAKQH
ncbi:MAG: DUF2809 domain-containing protein [Pseudomonadota bacterium]